MSDQFFLLFIPYRMEQVPHIIMQLTRDYTLRHISPPIVALQLIAC